MVKDIANEVLKYGAMEVIPDYEEILKEEGNIKVFRYRGYKCLIRRNPLGALCGYVKIPNSRHRLAGMSYSEINEYYDDQLPSHGGLNYSGFVDFPKNQWIGFDCGHAFDVLPYRNPILKALYRGDTPFNIVGMPPATYKNMDYVENKIKQMVDYIMITRNRGE